MTVRLTRLSIQVAKQDPEDIRLTRLSAQVAIENAAITPVIVRLTRLSVQVARQDPNVQLTRLSLQITRQDPNVRLTRLSLQVAQRSYIMSDRTYVFSAQNQGWTEYSTRFLDAVVYLNERYLGLEGADGVYKALVGSVLFPPSVGSEVARISTGWIRLGGPGAKARVRRIETTLKMAAKDTFTVNMYRDFIPDVYKTRSVLLGENPHDISPTTTQERTLALDGWGDRLFAVKFEFEFATLTEPFVLEGLTIFFTGGPDFIGERHSTGVGGEPGSI